MNARPKRRGRRDDGRRSFRLDAAKCASTGEAPVADDIRFDRRNLDFVIFADQFPRGVRRESSAALLAYARRVVAKLIGIVRKPTVVRLMPQLPPRRAESSRAFPFCPSRAASTTCANSYRVAEAGAPTRSIALCSGAANQCGPSTQGFRDRRSWQGGG